MRKLFRAFDAAGDRAYKTKRKLVDQLIRELAIHSAIEEELFHPTARERVKSTQDEVLESLEEHHIVKLVLSELESMDRREGRFDAGVGWLRRRRQAAVAVRRRSRASTAASSGRSFGRERPGSASAAPVPDSSRDPARYDSSSAGWT